MVSKKSLLVVVCLTFAIFCSCKQKLDGTWISQNVGDIGTITAVFAGDKIDAKAEDSDVWYKITLIVGDKSDPQQCELRYDDAAQAEVIGSYSKAIYKLEKNTLMLAVNQPGYETYPSSFEPSGEIMIFEFTRQK